MRTKPALLISVPLLLMALPAPCLAQWRTQQIPLVPGWNAVYLEVQPEPRSCDEVFRNLPIQSVWKWDRRFSTIQFKIDPASLLPEDPDWQMWLPPTDSRAFLNRLLELQGCQSYLIKVAANAAPFTLSVKGRVIVPRFNWYPHGLNLVGFPVNPQNPPTFTEFFRFTTEVNTSLGYGNQLYRLDSTGRGLQIVQPTRERMAPGVAYWVACARAPQGISVIDNTASAKVEFGTVLTEQSLHIRNRHPMNTLTFWVRQRDSETPPATGRYPELAGPVPLSYEAKNASNQWEWTCFPTGGLSHVLAPGEEWQLQLGVRRKELNAFTPQGTNGTAYQSILEITDAANSLLIRVPVSAEKANGLTLVGMDSHSENEGLWVGQATVNQVNAPAYTTNALLYTPAPASFRLLVHVDSAGNAKLLQQVLLAWDSTLTDPPHTNGTYALYVNDAALPDNATDVKRISSAAFPLMTPVLMTNTFANPQASSVVLSNTLAASVVVRFDDPVNPFLHRYHPRHDNKNWNFQSYTNALETRTIQRDIELEVDPATHAPASPYWGSEAVSGTYRETVCGLRAQPLYVQGKFTLQRISRINTLRVISP